MKPILLCVATKKGHEVLQEALEHCPRQFLSVCVISEPNTAEPFDEAIRRLARDAGVPIIPWSSFRSDPVGFLRSHEVGTILCISWRYLIPPPALTYLEGEVIVAHDSLLPKFRGFAPLPTALIVGEERTGVTFLRAAPGMDEGDILWQGSVPIEPTDTIGTLIDKICPLYRAGARRCFQGELVHATPQDSQLATYSLWRDELDYRVDWSEDAEQIERTIRALGPPYLGAQAMLGGKIVFLHQAEVLPDLDFAIRQTGKIWSLDCEGRPTIVCGKGLLKLLRATSAQGVNLFPLKALRQRFC
jgi:methionyl-tRNA formyltransferase